MLKMFNRIAFYSRNRSAVPFFALGRKKGAQSSVGDASNEDSTPHWHHELPQGVFLTDGSRPLIRGIDKDFINKRIYGIILLPKDHMQSIIMARLDTIHPGDNGLINILVQQKTLF